MSVTIRLNVRCKPPPPCQMRTNTQNHENSSDCSMSPRYEGAFGYTLKAPNAVANACMIGNDISLYCRNYKRNFTIFHQYTHPHLFL